MYVPAVEMASGGIIAFRSSLETRLVGTGSPLSMTRCCRQRSRGAGFLKRRGPRLPCMTSVSWLGEIRSRAPRSEGLVSAISGKANAGPPPERSMATCSTAVTDQATSHLGLRYPRYRYWRVAWSDRAGRQRPRASSLRLGGRARSCRCHLSSTGTGKTKHTAPRMGVSRASRWTSMRTLPAAPS